MESGSVYLFIVIKMNYTRFSRPFKEHIRKQIKILYNRLKTFIV